MNVDKSAIKTGLKQAGIGKGELIFVHSSLSAFGNVIGGAETVIAALRETIGENGTIVMPTFTWGGFHNAHDAIFDVLNTPSECGRITEVFRKQPGVLRSIHLCHSVAACGPLAKQMLGDGISGFGKGSPLDMLYQLDGTIILLGVTFTSCTALHTAEEFMLVPYRIHRNYTDCRVLLPDGNAITSEAQEFLRQGDKRNNFEKMDKIFSDRGILKTSKAGNAVITTVKARAVINTALELLKKDINFLLADPA